MSSIGSILTKAACEKKDGRRAGQQEREGVRNKREQERERSNLLFSTVSEKAYDIVVRESRSMITHA